MKSVQSIKDYIAGKFEKMSVWEVCIFTAAGQGLLFALCLAIKRL